MKWNPQHSSPPASSPSVYKGVPSDNQVIEGGALLNKPGLGHFVDSLPPPVGTNVNWSQFDPHTYGAIISKAVHRGVTQIMERGTFDGTLCWICPTSDSQI